MRAATAAVLLILLGLAHSSCGGDSESTADDFFSDAQGGYYIALGDSIAAGTGSSDGAGYDTPIFQALLARAGPDLIMEHRGQPGATTQTLIDDQLPEALGRLRSAEVGLVTITIGGNDLNVIQTSPDAATCIADVDDPACPVAEILRGTEERLNRILGDLREAGPDLPIVIQLYPNLFSGTGHPFEMAAGQAFGKLNEVIERVAAKHDALLADPRATFEGQAADLTHTLDPTPDFHPNDAGYAAIATAFLEVLGLSD
jgi:lysophospholipase L1-like esterase